jgi:hypothetical protein
MIIDYHKQYVETGMIFVPRIISPAVTARLRVICEHCLSQWRVRAASDPQGTEAAPDAHVIRHLNDPQWYDARHRAWLVELLDVVADPHILDIVREVFDDEVLFRTTSLFFNPLHSSLDGNWHRDSQFTSADEPAEKSRVLEAAQQLKATGRPGGMQLQIALVPSDDSEYVPGSHLRWDTDAEYAIRLADGQRQNRSNLMPNAVRTHQEPGDAAAFHAFGLHRGRYHADRYRRTLMLTYTAASTAQLKLDTFNRQPWCVSAGYLDGVKPTTREFFERFIERFEPLWRSEGLTT